MKKLAIAMMLGIAAMSASAQVNVRPSDLRWRSTCNKRIGT